MERDFCFAFLFIQILSKKAVSLCDYMKIYNRVHRPLVCFPPAVVWNLSGAVWNVLGWGGGGLVPEERHQGRRQGTNRLHQQSLLFKKKKVKKHLQTHPHQHFRAYVFLLKLHIDLLFQFLLHRVWSWNKWLNFTSWDDFTSEIGIKVQLTLFYCF